MSAEKITVKAIVDASAKQVWNFWTEPQHIMQWNNASDDWHTPSATSDLKEGGKFTSRMEAKDGSFGFDFGGVFTKVIPQQNLEYVIGDGRTVSVTFQDQEGKILITETFEAEGENPVEMQRQGWQAILDNFKKYTESK